MNITLYKKPDRTESVISIRLDNREDEWWFLSKGVQIAIKEVSGCFLLHARLREKDNDGHPVIITETNTYSTTMNESMHNLRLRCEQMCSSTNNDRLLQMEQGVRRALLR